jgi:hypothetical protein
LSTDVAATPRPGPARRPLFVSHAADDNEGRLFLHDVFSRDDSGWRPVFYSVEGPKAPHAKSILDHLEAAGGLIVLLSAALAARSWTRSWVGFEVGVAAKRGLPILVVEPPQGNVGFPVPGVTHYARRLSKATAVGTTFWAKVARTDFLPVADEPWDAQGESFGTRALAFFYNLNLKTHSVEGSFTQFHCSHSGCLASYFVEDSLLYSPIQCPSCRKGTATPYVQLQQDLAELAQRTAKRQ